MGMLMFILVGTGASVAQDAPGPKVFLNQDYLESTLTTRNFEISNMMDVFQHVFSSLPDKVHVYPTENYFYFQFGYEGLTYAGNMRLDVHDRDKGTVHFAYFSQYEDWNSEQETHYKPLGLEDGVTVSKLDDLVYTISFRGRTVTFELNNLSHIRPPADVLADGETFLGPVFDESGIQFYLVFNKNKKYLTFILNEDVPSSDRLFAYLPEKPFVLIGVRTGFAYFQDPYRDRKILIGVYQGNVQNNNYFDGPFDQLPDNFIKGNELQDAILTLYPELEGEIDRLGNFQNFDGRVLVNPYINYSYLGELDPFLECRNSAKTDIELYLCLQPPQPEPVEQQEESPSEAPQSQD